MPHVEGAEPETTPEESPKPLFKQNGSDEKVWEAEGEHLEETVASVEEEKVIQNLRVLMVSTENLTHDPFQTSEEVKVSVKYFFVCLYYHPQVN